MLPEILDMVRIVWTRMLLAACLFMSPPARAAESPSRPNIVFILADDLATDGVGAYGNVEIRTPHIDRLAERGTMFRHAYNPGSWHPAVCIASRTMLNTGRFLWKAQRLDPKVELRAGRFWPVLLKRAGYETYLTGKWHVDADTAEAFDHVVHERPGGPDTPLASYHRPEEGRPDPWTPWDESLGGYWKGGKHWSEALADDAVEFIEQASRREKPFFMYLAFNAPHDPRQAPRRYIEMYPLSRIHVPSNFLPEYPYAALIGHGGNLREPRAKGNLRDETLAPFPRTPYAVKVHRQEYYAAISHLDDQVGRILDALEKSGKADQTWIIFTSDHGLAVGHHGIMGKQNMHEHSVGVPLIVVEARANRGKSIDARVYLQDIMPTTLELAGVEPPNFVEFRSLLPLLRGNRARQYESIYGAYLNRQRMIIEGDHKLIVYPDAAASRLYNLKDDPHEMHDLAGDAAHQDLVHKLLASLRRLERDAQGELNL